MSTSGRRPAALPIAAVLAIIGLCVLLPPASVLAQTNLTAMASTGVGVTDNVANTSTGSAGAQYGALWLASVGLDGSWTGQKQSHELRYSFGISRSLSQTGRQRQTHLLSWNGRYSPSGVFSVSGGVSTSLSRLDAIYIPSTNTASPSNPTAAPSAATPIPSATTYFSATAHLAAAWHPTPRLSWTENTSVHAALPVEGTQTRSTYGVDEAVAHDRMFGLNSFITSATVGYLVAAELKDSLGNVVLGESESVHGRILVGWRRSLTPFTDVNASVGGLGALSPAGGPIVLGPSWRAGVSYRREFGTVSAEVDRTPAPSLYVGRVSVSDRLMVGLGLPIDRAGRFHALGSLGYSHVRFLDSSNNLVPGTDVLMANAGVSFHPLLWPVSFGLHYVRLQQYSHPVNGAPALPDMERQVLMLTVNGTWSRYPAGGGAGAAGAPEGM
jgi:hypothetical protein